MKLSLLLLIIGLISCNNRNNIQRIENKPINNESYIIEDTLHELNGVWAKNEIDNPELVIENAKIRGSEEVNVEWYGLTLKNDTLIIDYGDNIIGKNKILRISKDSLILKNEDGSISKLYKRK